VKRGRLKLSVAPAAFVSATYRDRRFSFVAVDERITRTSVELPDLHRDPADRLILATTVEVGARLVSKDGRLREYGVCEVVW
jgi:PIN domain nuclease of toxin-antitoxin system